MRFASACAAAAMGLALASIAPAQIAAAGTVRAAATQGSGLASFHLPYADPGQAGWLTLCNQANVPVTQGSITAKPFVWRVVSNVPTLSGYRIKGATAQLFAYQPRPYTPPGAWSGLSLAAASVYSNLAHPMAQFTPIDEPLNYMTESFPPIWDSLVELRLYLGAPDRPEYEARYAAADLQIKGNTWTLVSGGNDSCTSGTAVSREVILGLPGAKASQASQVPATRATGRAAAGRTASATSSAAPATGPSSPVPAGTATAALADARHSDSALYVVAIVFGVLAIATAGTGGLLWRRRRRASP
jgi:hypothetical protein